MGGVFKSIAMRLNGVSMRKESIGNEHAEGVHVCHLLDPSGQWSGCQRGPVIAGLRAVSD